MDETSNPPPSPSTPPYDVVILGASGFTGKYVVREALKLLNSGSLKSLAISGRNHSKLSATLNWAANPHSPPPSIPILAADTTDPVSLRVLCSQTKLLLNCVGPFRLHGGTVVAACVEAGCDYLDICGEPEFMEMMEVRYHEEAAEKGALVVSGCGFDSIPAELGWMFNSKQWVSPAVPNRIEVYLRLGSETAIVGNLRTYESAVLGVANVEELKELRRCRPRRAKPKIPGPFPHRTPIIDYQKELGIWSTKLPSADSTVVRRTIATLAKHPLGLPGAIESDDQTEKRERFWSTIKPAYFTTNLGSKRLSGIFRFIALCVFIAILGTSSVGRRLLLKFPSFFSLGWFSIKGPSEDEVASASFDMWFVGRGYTDSSRASSLTTATGVGDDEKEVPLDAEIVTRVRGPDAGYLTTPIVLLQCTLVVLGQRDSLPRGGVLTPGIVFGPTDFQKRLQHNGISFDVVSTKNVPTK